MHSNHGFPGQRNNFFCVLSFKLTGASCLPRRLHHTPQKVQYCTGRGRHPDVQVCGTQMYRLRHPDVQVCDQVSYRNNITRRQQPHQDAVEGSFRPSITAGLSEAESVKPPFFAHRAHSKARSSFCCYIRPLQPHHLPAYATPSAPPTPVRWSGVRGKFTITSAAWPAAQRCLFPNFVAPLKIRIFMNLNVYAVTTSLQIVS